MNSVIKASVALAVLVTIVSVIFVAAGLHESSPMLGIVLILLFIGLNVGCLFWALSPTAAVNGYGKQMLNVGIFGVVAAVVIFGLLVGTFLLGGAALYEMVPMERPVAAMTDDARNLRFVRSFLHKAVEQCRNGTPSQSGVRSILSVRVLSQLGRFST